MTIKTITAEGQSAVHQWNAGRASASAPNYTTTAHNSVDLEKLLRGVHLEDLVREAGGKLRQNGRELRGACPLHQGNNPTAFTVFSDETGRQRWRCHTQCAAGGDAIDFVRRWRSLDFMGTVHFLAEQAGLDLEQLGLTPLYAQAENNRRKQGDVLDEAARYFASNLWGTDGKAARAYLLKRGFTEKTLREANWGFNKPGVGLFKHLEQAQAEISLAQELTLLRKDRVDFTANANGREAAPDGYILYPHIWNGHTVYFSARALNPLDPDDKSRNLPGERQVYWALVPGDLDVVVVEGQADAESLRQIGRSALALCGVGRLPEHELHRLRKKRTVYLALDNDLSKPDLPATEQAKIRQRKAESTARLSESLGPLTMVLGDLPYKDINDWLQNGLDLAAWERHLPTAHAWLDLQIEQARSAPPLEQDERLRAILAALPGLPETIRARYVAQVERKLGLSRRDIKRLMKNDENAQRMTYAEIKEKRLCFLGEPLGNFWAHITHELSVDDGLTAPSVRYQIRGGLDTGEPLPPVSVEAQDFARLDWIPGQWGMRPILHLPPGKGHLLARAMQEVSLDEVVRERLYTFTGWVEHEGRRGYLTTTGLLTSDGLDSSVRVDLGTNNLRHYALPEPSRELEAQKQAVRASLEFLQIGPRSVTAPIWAAMYAAPLNIFRSLNAVMDVYGTTQSGKSTIAHLALTHFGPGFIQGRDYHAPMDWTSTVTSIEGALFTAKDCPMVVDDFAPQFASLSEARDMHRKASLVVRSVGNRSARGRARADLSQQTTRFPRGLALMTAENPLVGQSIVGRMIYVPIEPGQVLPSGNEAGLGSPSLNALQVQAQAGLLAQAMSLYIQYLAQHWARIAENFPAMVDAASEAARREKQLQNRLPDAFGVLTAAQEVALRAFQDLGLIDGAEADRLAEENRAALLDLIVGQAERIAAESPVRKLFEALGSLLERRKVYLAPRTKTVGYEPPFNAELIGYFEPDHPSVVHLRTEVCLAQAKAFWRSLDENLDIMPDALRRQMGQVPALLAEKDTRQTEMLKYCAGVNQRVLVVDTWKLSELYGVTLANSRE